MASAGRCRLVRRGVLSAVLGTLACVVVAAPVYAFVSRRTHVSAVPPSAEEAVTFGSSTATCPAGQHVLFGGFDGGEAGMRRTADNRWTVYSFTVIRQNGVPPFNERIPFVVATVDLDEEGARMIAAMPSLDPDLARVGMRVRASYRPAGDELGFVDFVPAE